MESVESPLVGTVTLQEIIHTAHVGTGTLTHSLIPTPSWVGGGRGGGWGAVLTAGQETAFCKHLPSCDLK